MPLSSAAPVSFQLAEQYDRFGPYLRFLRRRARLTQAQLGVAVGYSSAHICLLERGDRLPDLTALAAVFVPALELRFEPDLAERLLALGTAARAARAPAAHANPPAILPLPASTARARALPEPLARLTLWSGRDTRSPSRDDLLAAARYRPATPTEYRLHRLAALALADIAPEPHLISLTLFLDQGAAVRGRWVAASTRLSGLGALLAATSEPALAILGPPGSGKSTLLGQYEAASARSGLPAPVSPKSADSAPFPIAFALNQYRGARPEEVPPSPADWLAERWEAQYPAMWPLADILAELPVVFLLDGLNEIPALDSATYWACVGAWKDWLVRLASDHPNARAVFTCRTLDYSAPLSTPALPVPQAQIDPLSDEDIQAFLRSRLPEHWQDLWSQIADSHLLDVCRSPYWLRLLVEEGVAADEVSGEQAAQRISSDPNAHLASGDPAAHLDSSEAAALRRPREPDAALHSGKPHARLLSSGPAALLTGFARRAMRRELEAGHPRFASEALLTERDARRLIQGGQPPDPYDLPSQGRLIAGLEQLAYAMQASEGGDAVGAAGGSQVRADYGRALDLIGDEEAEGVVRAGMALGILEDDTSADEVYFRHQLFQEYFAARRLARQSEPARVATPWQADRQSPPLAELYITLPVGQPLPELPTTGWEETTLLAAAMALDPDAFVTALMPANLVLAGRAALLPEVRPRLGVGVLDELRRALLGRSRDERADLRDRRACGLALGGLGDPRFVEKVGAYGRYRLIDLVEIAAGTYVLGDDLPLELGEDRRWANHLPRHSVDVAGFRMAALPVTNAEFACFMAAGGYEEATWWDLSLAAAWRDGTRTTDGQRENQREWWRRFRAEPDLFERIMHGHDERVERWRRWVGLEAAAFEVELAALYPAGRMVEPRFWRDARFNHPAQPVVGVAWYEARAYCRWLAAQTGEPYRLPTEAEWQAAARGTEGRRYVCGEAFEAECGNTLASRLFATTPVGIFPRGDTPEGAGDLLGNCHEWTSSALQCDPEGPNFDYPYRANDGREAAEASALVRRVALGGAWDIEPELAVSFYRQWFYPDNRYDALGFRVVCGVGEVSA